MNYYIDPKKTQFGVRFDVAIHELYLDENCSLIVKDGI